MSQEVQVIAVQDERELLYEVIELANLDEEPSTLQHLEIYKIVKEASEILVSPKENDAGALLKITLFKIQQFMKLAERLKLEGSMPSHTRHFYKR